MGRNLAGGNLRVLGDIRREAINEGCTNIRLISQAPGASELSQVMKDAEKGGGLCRSMSIRWLRGRAGGDDFLSQLLPPGKPVNKALVAEMAAEYDALGQQVMSAQMKYIIEQVCEGMENQIVAQGGAETSWAYTLNGKIGSWFLDKSAGELRSINCSGYWHAMAIDMRENYALFFDPNWGEFTFSSHASLLSFLDKSIFVGDKYCDVKEIGNVARAKFKSKPNWEGVQTRKRR